MTKYCDLTDEQKEVLRAQERERYRVNKEKYGERAKMRREQNREKCREDSKKYRERYKELRAEKHKEYYATNKERISERGKLYRELNKEARAASGKRYRSEAWTKRLLYSTRVRATKAGLPFNLTEEDLVIPEVCPVLGIPIAKQNAPFKDGSPSIDKIIPSMGYVKGNVRIISFRANRIKSDATPEELVLLGEYGKWIQQYLQNKEQ